MKHSIVTIILLISPICDRVQTVQGVYIMQQEGRSGEVAGKSVKDGGEATDFLKLYAQSVVLMDGSSGRILYGKGQDIIRPMVSTTKIMACILALGMGNLEDSVTVSSTTTSQPKVHLGIRSGEKYCLGDLLYALMLESYNDAAVMIAENIGGDVEGFAVLMDEKAKSLERENTYFIIPSELDGVEKDKDGTKHIHSTAASDLVATMRYCVAQSPKKDESLKIAQTQNYSFFDSSGKRSYSCYNRNTSLNMMQDVLSGKTGFIGGAGYSYVGAMENGERTYIIALLECGWLPHKIYKWTDARELHTYSLDRYNIRDVFCEKKIPDIPMTGGLCWEEGGNCQEFTGASSHLSEEERKPSMPLKEDEQVQVTVRIPSILEVPVREGQRIETINYNLDGALVKQFLVYADRGVKQMTFFGVVRHVLGISIDFGKSYHII